MFAIGFSPSFHSALTISAADSGSTPGPSFGTVGCGSRNRAAIQSYSSNARRPAASAEWRSAAVIRDSDLKLAASSGMGLRWAALKKLLGKSKTSENLVTVASLGADSPVSKLVTALRDKPARSASCCLLSPRLSRARVNRDGVNTAALNPLYDDVQPFVTLIVLVRIVLDLFRLIGFKGREDDALGPRNHSALVILPPGSR